MPLGEDELPTAAASLVHTALGPVPAQRLGVVLSHDHVFMCTPHLDGHPGHGDEAREQRIAPAVEKLRTLRAAGVNTIVDPTVDGIGRDVPHLLKVARQVPELNIVLATGLYTFTEVPQHLARRVPLVPGRPDPLVKQFVGDLREGIPGTGVRAAFLKCAIDAPGLTPGVERVMRAVAQAHLVTGAPVMVHTHPGTRTAVHVRRVLEGEGVDPTRVQLAHCGDGTDVDHLAELADAGYLLGMDRFGVDSISPTATRVDVLTRLCRRGYADAMTLSQDAACHIAGVSVETLASMPNWTYLHVLGDVLPQLRQRGVGEADITAMLTTNPRRWLAG